MAKSGQKCCKYYHYSSLIIVVQLLLHMSDVHNTVAAAGFPAAAAPVTCCCFEDRILLVSYLPGDRCSWSHSCGLTATAHLVLVSASKMASREIYAYQAAFSRKFQEIWSKMSILSQITKKNYPARPAAAAICCVQTPKHY